MGILFNFTSDIYCFRRQMAVTVIVRRYDDASLEVQEVLDVGKDIKEKLPLRIVEKLLDEARDLWPWLH